MYEMRRDTGSTNAAPNPIRVHHSRVIRFEGISSSNRRTRWDNWGWGESVLGRLVNVLQDFDTSFATIPVLLQDFAQAVFKMKGLADALAADSEALVAQRLAELNKGRSIVRAVVMDAEDDFKREATPLSGLPEVLDRECAFLTALSGMPKSLLMGDDPAGMNATGDANVRWFYDDLRGERELNERPKWNALIKLIFQSTEGPTGGVEPEKWSIAFGEMWLPTATETADTRLKTAQADKLYADAGVLTPEEIASSRFGGDEWSADTRLDAESRELQAEAAATAPDDAAALLAETQAPEKVASEPQPNNA
jgi:phage-related protein (TIGR01555 family)